MIESLPFRPRSVPPDTPDKAIRLMRAQLLHEYSYRLRILQAPPLSSERTKLIHDLYEGTWRIIADIEKAQGKTTPYHGGFQDRSMHARSLTRLVQPGRCLEIGCGGGALCRHLSLLGWEVLGVDVVEGPDWRRIVAESSGRVRLEVREFATATPQSLGRFELVVLDGCLEHIPPGDHEATVANVFSVLVPGGWIVVIVPNPLTGPHDCSINFLPKGAEPLGGHFAERTMAQATHDLRMTGFENFKTVVSYGIHSGVKYGWSQFWHLKASLFECLLARLPGSWWSDTTFEFCVPYVLAAQKPDAQPKPTKTLPRAQC